MWDKVTPEEGSRREQELMSSNTLFKPMLDGGAIMIRHDRTAESADKVINYLLGRGATTPQIVRELVEEKTLEMTAAGGELRSEVEELMNKNNEEIKSLKVEMKLAAKREFAEERQSTNHRLAKLMAELDELKRGITRPITECVSKYVQNSPDGRFCLSDLPPESELIRVPQSSPNRNQVIGNDTGDRIIASVY